MLFTPIVMVCLVSDPTLCGPVMGGTEFTETDCMDSLAQAVVVMETIPDRYIAGLACVETHLLEESASNQ
jgi:hypothetical protein